MYRKHPFLSTLIFFVLITVITANVQAQKKRLTYNQADQRGNPQLLGTLPRMQGWLDNNHYLELKSEKKDKKTNWYLMKVNAVTGKATRFIDYQSYKDKLPTEFSLRNPTDRTDDYSHFLFNRKDDLYYFYRKTGFFKQLTSTTSEENNPRFSPDGRKIAYTRDRDLYVVDIETGLEHQLTNDGSKTIYNGYASWVYFEEILGRRSRYGAFWWAPNSQMIAFLRFDDSPVPTFPLYRADGVHGKLEIQHYPKPGDPNPRIRLGIAHLETGEIVWVDIDEQADHYVAWPFWTPDSKQLFFQWMSRGQDHIILYSANPETGQKTQIHEEKQSAWVSWFTDLHFFEDGSGFLLRSDVAGWSHLYTYDMKGRLKKRLTSGEWRVRNIARVDEKNKRVYIQGSKENSTESHLYSVGFDGKNLKQLTDTAGSHRCQVSPGGKYYIDTFSNIHQPSKMELVTAKDGKTLRTLGDQKLPITDEYDLGKVELFTVPSGDGYDLPAIWTLPPDFDESKKYPVIFAIYSGPGSARVSNSYGRLSTHFLAQHGIITFSVDHRGSGHFGKKCVALMHRNLGKWEMNDLIIAVKWLRTLPYIDEKRIGITGGSYGGYTTCMALTYGADYFTHGIAGSSVTDWKLYDTVYTERYMDTPEENPEGYKFGSVMTHADKFKGTLLITHGTIDDNVHMQNTIQLIDKLTALNKDFELMLYPNERHGIGLPKRNHSTRESVQFWFRHFLGSELNTEESE